MCVHNDRKILIVEPLLPLHAPIAWHLLQLKNCQSLGKVAAVHRSVVVTTCLMCTGHELHIVSPGETVQALALTYSMTKAEFRKLNNLQATAQLVPGRPVIVKSKNVPKVLDLSKLTIRMLLLTVHHLTLEIH